MLWQGSSSLYVCAFVIVVVYACLVSAKHWSPIVEKKKELIHCIQGSQRKGRGRGFWSNFFLTSGTDFHGKAALINMALKPGTFYFVHKDHCNAFE